MQLRLRIQTHDQEGFQTEVTLSEEGGVVGRKGKLLSFRDARCSRQHALIYVDMSGEVRIKDLDSLNGTWVNGERISRSALNDGDLLLLGNTRLAVVKILRDQEEEICLGWPGQWEAVGMSSSKKY